MATSSNVTHLLLRQLAKELRSRRWSAPGSTAIWTSTGARWWPSSAPPAPANPPSCAP